MDKHQQLWLAFASAMHSALHKDINSFAQIYNEPWLVQDNQIQEIWNQLTHESQIESLKKRLKQELNSRARKITELALETALKKRTEGLIC